MIFNKTMILLILAGSIPIALANLLGIGGIAFIAYNIILFLLWAYDMSLTPKISSLEITRSCDSKLSLGVFNEIRLSVRNKSPYALHIKLRDDVPDYCNPDRHILTMRAVPWVDTSVSYHVKPIKRGEFTFGTVTVNIRGVLGLCMRTGKFGMSRSIKVYPNLKDLRGNSLLAIRRKNITEGSKRFKDIGTGTEFESIREYFQGDDFRKINWMATGREAKLMVNNYEPERNQHVYLMMDTSRVMNTEINQIKKLDYAVNAAFLLAETALNNGDNIGLLSFDSEVHRFVKPGKGPGHFQILAENLYNIQQRFTSPDYDRAFRYLNEIQKRRSLLCIFTDIYNIEHAVQLASSIRFMASGHRAVILLIKDKNLFSSANQPIKEFESILVKSAALRILGERKKALEIFKSSSIPYIESDPEHFSMQAVSAYLEMKRRNVI